MSDGLNLRVMQPLADFRDALTTCPPSSLVKYLVALNIAAPPDELGKLAALLEHGLQFDHTAGATPSLIDMDQAHIDLYALHGITPENNYHFHNWLWTNVGSKDRATHWPRLARCEASIRQSERAPYFILCLLTDLNDDASAQVIVDTRRQAFDEMCQDEIACGAVSGQAPTDAFYDIRRLGTLAKSGRHRGF